MWAEHVWATKWGKLISIWRPCYLSLLLPLELLPVDPARVRLPLESPESFRVRVPTCSFELALLTVLWWEGRWTEAKRESEGTGEAQEIGHKTTWCCFSKNALWLSFHPRRRRIYFMIQLRSASQFCLKKCDSLQQCQREFAPKQKRNKEMWIFVVSSHSLFAPLWWS